MEFVIDTNILINGFKENIKTPCIALLSHFYGNYHLKIVWDHMDINGNQVVRGEYNNNLRGVELYQKWITALTAGGQIVYESGELGAKIKIQLTKLGFHEETDQTFVALSINTAKNIITEDSDYGKGDNPRAIEPDKQAILNYLTNTLGLKVMDSEEGLIFLRSS